MPENCFDVPASERGSFFFRIELFPLTSVTDIKAAYFVGVSNGCWALKFWHMFYEEDIRENKISRWKIAIFKFIISKSVKGSRYSR